MTTAKDFDWDAAINLFRSHPGNIEIDTTDELDTAVPRCRNGLHPMSPENTYVNPTTGHRRCRACVKQTKRWADKPKQRRRTKIRTEAHRENDSPVQVRDVVDAVDAAVRSAMDSAVRDAVDAVAAPQVEDESSSTLTCDITPPDMHLPQLQEAVSSELDSMRQVLEKAEAVLRACERYFHYQAQMNAQTHMDENVKFSPIYDAVASTVHDIAAVRSAIRQ